MQKMTFNVINDNVELNEDNMFLYDSQRGALYQMNKSSFFREMNKRIEDYMTINQRQNLDLKLEFEKFKKEFKEFEEKVKVVQSQLIEMVEKFIKGEEE